MTSLEGKICIIIMDMKNPLFIKAMAINLVNV